MTVSPFDHPYMSALVGDDAMAAAFSARAEIEAILSFEMALARAAALEGLIPAEAATAVAEANAKLRPDRDGLRRAVATGSSVVPEVVAGLRRLVGPDREAHVHLGATDADAEATALALRLKGVVLDLDRLLGEAISRLDALVGSGQGLTIGIGTASQPLDPASVFAAWRLPLLRARGRLQALRPTLLVVSLGAGQASAGPLGDKGAAVVRRMADLLRLGVPDAAAGGQGETLAEFGQFLALTISSLAAIGNQMSRIDGAGENRALDAGVLTALARLATGLETVLQQAIVDGADPIASGLATRLALPQMVVATAAALRRLVPALDALSPGSDQHGDNAG